MIQLLALAALALVPAAALILSGVSKPAWVAIGAATWLASFVLKMAVYKPLKRAISRPALGPKTQAAMWGAWSALAELGLVAAFFALISIPPDVGNAIGLGVGAGALEVIFLVGISLIPSAEPPAKEETPKDWFVRCSGVFERTHTIVGHAATRGLVWAAFRSWPLFPAALLGFATFALTDGLAEYGSSKGWNWTDPRVARRTQSFFALVSLFEAAVFAGVVFFRLGA